MTASLLIPHFWDKTITSSGEILESATTPSRSVYRLIASFALSCASRFAMIAWTRSVSAMFACFIRFKRAASSWIGSVSVVGLTPNLRSAASAFCVAISLRSAAVSVFVFLTAFPRLTFMPPRLLSKSSVVPFNPSNKNSKSSPDPSSFVISLLAFLVTR